MVDVGQERPETQEVRQYRFLLATCTTDALIGLHQEVLGGLEPSVTDRVLATVRDRTGTGLHLTPQRLADIARLFVLAETRGPGSVRDGLPGPTLQALARAALESEAAFGRFSGYLDWDGSDREAPTPKGDDGFTPLSWENRRTSGPIVGLMHPGKDGAAYYY